MQRVNQLIDASAVPDFDVGPVEQTKFRLLRAKALALRMLLVVTVLVGLCASTGCRAYLLCNGTGGPLDFKLDSRSAIQIEPCSCEVRLGVIADNLEIFALSGDLVYDAFRIDPLEWNTYDGFGMHDAPLNDRPDLTAKRRVLLCNESSEDVLIVPKAFDGTNEVSDAWRVPAGETVEFITVTVEINPGLTGERSFNAFMPGTQTRLDRCSIDLSDFDQVIWNGVDLICKEAVLVDLVNTSVADVDIVWLEGKGNLMRTMLEPGESLPLGVPEGEVANFDAEVGGSVVGSCTLDDPMAGHQIVWDGSELTGCDPPDPPPPLQSAMIDLNNIGTSTGPVIVVEAGKDPATDGVFVNRFDPGILEVPTGAPVTIQVWDAEGIGGSNPHLYGDCTINDPTDGDSVTWDGVDVTCEDL